MAALSPPEGMNELDFEMIEAAVTETARGRWFLNEFARRNRSGELRQLLDAMGRLEGAITTGQTKLPPADPSIRLLVQRIKDIAGQLDMLSLDMRAAGVEERFAAAVEKEARAVSGMMRGPALPKVSPDGISSPVPPPYTSVRAAPKAADAERFDVTPAPQVDPGPPAPSPPGAARSLLRASGAVTPDDPRLAALSRLDELSLAEKLTLFA